MNTIYCIILPTKKISFQLFFFAQTQPTVQNASTYSEQNEKYFNLFIFSVAAAVYSICYNLSGGIMLSDHKATTCNMFYNLGETFFCCLKLKNLYDDDFIVLRGIKR